MFKNMRILLILRRYDEMERNRRVSMSGGVRNPGQAVQFYPARLSILPKLESGWAADRTSCRPLRQIGFMTRPTQNRSRYESRGTREAMAGHRGCEKLGRKCGKGRKSRVGRGSFTPSPSQIRT